MCLYNAKLIQPTEDIICYKVLIGHRRDNKFVSPYQNCPYEIGKKLKLRRSNPEIVGRRAIVGSSIEQIIEGGAYHSFSDKNQAKKCAKVANFGSRPVVVVECVIPKTAKYVYEGSYGSRSCGSYASSEITPVKVIYQPIK